jgi:hypothetical protein
MPDKDEIITKHWINPLDIKNTGKLRKQISKMMDEWASEQMIRLIENISRQPVQVYSQKHQGKEKEYFLGRAFVEDLKERLKQ